MHTTIMHVGAYGSDQRIPKIVRAVNCRQLNRADQPDFVVAAFLSTDVHIYSTYAR